MITKKDVESFLLSKKGYLKKSPTIVLHSLWRNLPKNLPKTVNQISKELELVKTVQQSIRESTKIIVTDNEQDLLNTYNLIKKEKDKPRRKLFFDIEVSPNIVLSWRIGSEVSLSTDDILKERAIICICWKWSDSNEVFSLSWDKGNDESMVRKFAKIFNSADEVVTQNGDSFDIKWLRTRCLYYNIPLIVKANSIDTLKMAKASFKFNSNKLDYMGNFLKVGGKLKTSGILWRKILIENCKSSMSQMIDYCKKDVILLEDVYNKIQPYCQVKKFKYRIPQI